jgi:hypothetical protein
LKIRGNEWERRAERKGRAEKTVGLLKKREILDTSPAKWGGQQLGKPGGNWEIESRVSEAERKEKKSSCRGKRAKAGSRSGPLVTLAARVI